jgi:hypothetical protein
LPIVVSSPKVRDGRVLGGDGLSGWEWLIIGDNIVDSSSARHWEIMVYKIYYSNSINILKY